MRLDRRLHYAVTAAASGAMGLLIAFVAYGGGSSTGEIQVVSGAATSTTAAPTPTLAPPETTATPLVIEEPLPIEETTTTAKPTTTTAKPTTTTAKPTTTTAKPTTTTEKSTTTTEAAPPPEEPKNDKPSDSSGGEAPKGNSNNPG